MTEIQLGRYKFKGICRIIPELNAESSPIEYMPQSTYNNVRKLELNGNGSGPFCKFRIPNSINEVGVYAVLVNYKLKYIGKCNSLSPRWNAGYGNISPRNCFKRGQSTNCRLNNFILNAYKAKNYVDLYFCKTDNSSDVEDDLIELLNPEWNIKKATRHTTNKKPPIKNLANKYQPLLDYLLGSEKSIECLTYAALEKILGFKLPNSAYEHRQWWANSGHSHANTWANAGRQIVSVKLGESVAFKKNQSK